jgi:hypothetical protein
VTKTAEQSVIRATLMPAMLVWVGLTPVWCVLWGWSAAAGWTVGSAFSAGVVLSLEWFVRRSFIPGNAEARTALNRFSLAKLPVVLALLALVVWLGGRSFGFVAAFCAGVSLFQMVIVIRSIGGLLAKSH